MIERRWIVNGEERTVRFAPLARLLDVLRQDLGLLSLKEGCGEGECGTCSVILDGELHLSCLVAAAQLDDGTRVLTAEGIEARPLGRALRAAFAEQGAVQCGYCSPGMLLGGLCLLEENVHPTEEQVRAGLAGHLCRCTGYTSIVAAVLDVAGGRR